MGLNSPGLYFYDTTIGILENIILDNNTIFYILEEM